MKQKDIAAIVLIAAIAAVISYFVANAVIGKPENKTASVEKVTPISANFKTPDTRIFNDQAIDATVEIQGSGESTNQVFSNPSR